MNFLKYELNLGPDDLVEVDLDRQANVRLLDESNFHSYRNGRAHRYVGGLVRSSPYRVRAPHAGRWYVVIDLGGYAGSVRASVQVRSVA